MNSELLHTWVHPYSKRTEEHMKSISYPVGLSQPREIKQKPSPLPAPPKTVAVKPAGLAGSTAAACRLNVTDYSSSITRVQWFQTPHHHLHRAPLRGLRCPSAYW